MVNAVERVRQRLLRATGALRAAGVDYAVAGGNAVAAWVAKVDESAVRNTQDVDILVRRSDFDSVRAALESVGFVYRHVANLDVFLDGADSKAREAVHIIFANELVRADDPETNPDVTESEVIGTLSVLHLEALVRNKLTAFRRKDQVHLLDMLGVDLIDATWTTRFSPILAARLQLLIDTPDG